MGISMRATIDQETAEIRLSIFKKATRYRVNLTIHFSEEELAIIKQHKLGDAIAFTSRVIDAANGPFDLDTSIDHLIRYKPCIRIFGTPLDAKNFQYMLETETLPNLKAYITQNVAEPSSKTLEY